MTETLPPPVLCPRCGKLMRSAVVKTAIWRDERVFLIEDIPAQVCDSCVKQWYDDDVTDALRRLAEDEFPPSEVKREILVPVFSLQGRIKRWPASVDPMDIS
jgi:YgiT-type zinc finger domain-containing protein